MNELFRNTKCINNNNKFTENHFNFRFALFRCRTCFFNLYSPVNRRKLFFYLFFFFCQFIVILPFKIGPNNKRDMRKREERERERERERRIRNFTESLICHEKSGGTSFRFVVKWFCDVQFYSLVRGTKCAHVCIAYYKSHGGWDVIPRGFSSNFIFGMP